MIIAAVVTLINCVFFLIGDYISERAKLWGLALFGRLNLLDLGKFGLEHFFWVNTSCVELSELVNHTLAVLAVSYTKPF